MSNQNKLAAGLQAVGGRARPAATAVRASDMQTDPAPIRRTRIVGERYEDRVRRATFHLEIALLEDLDAVVARTGISKAKIVNEAIRRHLHEL